jgi:hypothetical protein
MGATKGRNFVMKWTPDAVLKGADADMARGLERGAVFLVGEVKRVISKPGPMKGKLTKGQRKRLAAAGETRRASAPGEPPRKRLGTLRASIANEARENGMVQRVGSSVPYSLDLELGNSRLKPRPYLRPTLRSNTGKLNDIIVGTLKHG